MTNFADEQEITAASAKNPLSDGQDHPIGTDRLQKRHIGFVCRSDTSVGLWPVPLPPGLWLRCCWPPPRPYWYRSGVGNGLAVVLPTRSRIEFCQPQALPPRLGKGWVEVIALDDRVLHAGLGKKDATPQGPRSANSIVPATKLIEG